ncbi:hypothetical protein Salat_0175500 [Sesamum alatum]|uniref:Uncharacterized protein n=1 Tax=Sesamum alatum TaxID=300844 RepID=A0AAE1YYH2_9LAMI|nr:hypothetical protein Salat_0175500 [Sesamum alatum]
MAARVAMMANEARQRQEELVAIARAVEVEVDLEPVDVPPHPHAGVHDLDPSSPRNEGPQSPEVVRSPSPTLDVMPLRESIPALQVPEGGAPPWDAPSKAPSPKRRKSDKGKGIEGSGKKVVGDDEGVACNRDEEPQLINRPTIFGVCYKRLARAREEINQALKLNTRLSPNKTPLVPDWQVSGNSSIFHRKPRETSFEMYKVCLLPRDQIALASLHHARLEMLSAHLHH